MVSARLFVTLYQENTSLLNTLVPFLEKIIESRGNVTVIITVYLKTLQVCLYRIHIIIKEKIIESRGNITVIITVYLKTLQVCLYRIHIILKDLCIKTQLFRCN